jgi:hypothetical protein
MQDSAPSLRLLSDPVRFLLTFCYIFDKVLLSTRVYDLGLYKEMTCMRIGDEMGSALQQSQTIRAIT